MRIPFPVGNNKVKPLLSIFFELQYIVAFGFYLVDVKFINIEIFVFPYVYRARCPSYCLLFKNGDIKSLSKIQIIPSDVYKWIRYDIS